MRLIMDENRSLFIQEGDYTYELDSYIREKWGFFVNDTFRNQWEGSENAAVMSEENHSPHNQDPEYQEYMLDFIRKGKDYWNGRLALDIGCGAGRNIKNLLSCADFERVDGCDISEANCVQSKKYINDVYGEDKCITWRNDGISLRPAKDDQYDFIMSHIVFQHIPNYLIRYSLLNEIHRILKNGGTTIIHFMDLTESQSYYSLYPQDEDQKTNFNCRVEDVNYLMADFKSLGFRGVNCMVGTDPFSRRQSYYVRAKK
jgi:SAM-dependent methyltransferase